MEQKLLYSIGHGNRSIEDFIELLIQNNIQFILDVRSMPYSKYYPHFNREALDNILKMNNIKYVFMGDSLGGRPNDITCYTNGKVDYEKIKSKMFYQEGLDRVITAFEKDLSIALMCSESKPQECHRSKLIGESLIQKNIKLNHIDENGAIQNQIDVMLKLTKGRNTVDLFGQQTPFKSRKSYLDDEYD